MNKRGVFAICGLQQDMDAGQRGGKGYCFQEYTLLAALMEQCSKQ
jgi:hypothetical protein